MAKNTISLCMIVKNEEAHMHRCLDSIKNTVDEIIIVDTGSTDNTVQIAKSYRAKVITIPWKSDFASARNAGLSLASGSWILILDADEELDEKNRKELKICAEHHEFDGFFLQIYNHSGNTINSPVSTINPILRMFRNHPHHRFRGKIHEQIAYSIVERNPNPALHITNIVIHHYGYEEQLVIQKDKIRRNLDLLIQSLQEEPNDPFHHYNIAVEHMRVNNHESALPYLQTSLSLVNHEVSYTHLLYKYKARCLFALGHNLEAIQACESGIRLFPDYPDLFHIKAVIHSSIGDKTLARDAFLQAIQIGTAPMQYHTDSGIGTFLSTYGLGQVHEEIGEDNNAIHWYAETIRHNSQMSRPLQRIFRILKCTGSESMIPALLSERFSIKAPEAVLKVVNLLIEESCYTAALSLLTRLDDETYRQVRDEKIKICQLLSGQKHKNIWYWIGLDEPVLERSYMEGNDYDQFELAVKSAYYNDHQGKALELLRNWQPPIVTDSKAVQDEGYRRSRIWTALANAKIGVPDKQSPHYKILRLAKQSLPLSRGY
ncbi:hypothetical protein BC351_14795 [Paenibacillus ferrarius]|uniref:Glycosyltransferase 2-like domain-containing protein n=1 Tax=Paenibacillus ferrarius TaxID=1469647 RepID=A0A1V4HRD3_9BACL|nr:glycosyltransferase family 2 protein [Paenibacillus ferrarius]OPH61211.1 hypothetical protein BC351_14795 [Paenibacillus ferrarius]